MKLEFQPISSIADSYEWLPFVEVLALFNGSCAIDDLEWDEDSLLHSLLEDTVDVSLRADYEAEPTTGIQVAKDSFISDLRERIADQQTLVGSSYPFFLKNDGNIFLEVKPFENISEAAISYVWLSLFAVISSPSDYLIISPNDRDGFIRDFSKVFEYICCLVMASRSPAFIKYFGDSRDVREFLHRLGDVVYKVGTGTVKQFNQLQPNQTGTNDGGVDIFAIPTLQGAIPQNGTAYLVGVTIQKLIVKIK